MRMSAQSGGFEPATRVRSTNDGPAERRASRPPGAVAAAWFTSAPASTCGRCDTRAIRRSWTLGVDRHRAGADRRHETVEAGEQVRPRLGGRASGTRWRRGTATARANATPVRSAPQTGCPPMKRSRSAGRQRRRRRADLAEPRSVTRQSGPPAATARRASPAICGTGAASTTTSAPSAASSTEAAARRDGADGPRDAQGLGVGVDAAHLDGRALAQRQPERARP